MEARRSWLPGAALVLAALICAPAGAAGEEASAAGAAALTQLEQFRSAGGCAVGPTDESVQALAFRGRPSLEIKGRGREGDPAVTLRDFAVFDPAAARIVSYVCFVNASTRRSGEAIVSIAEVSGRADKLARALLPGTSLELEGVTRHRAGADAESVYYEARYAAGPGEFPFFEPPVRLLLNASTGTLFRADIDADWLDPVEPPRARISRKAAERIATVVLRGSDLVSGIGPGASFGSVAAAELFTVHPNDWLARSPGPAGERARIAWVVPFRVTGAAAGVHSLFVDAATGQVLGGQPGHAGAAPAPARDADR